MTGQKTRHILYKGDKVAEIKVHEQIRREGQELRSKAISRVEMWADGVGALNFSFRANAYVKGSADKNSTVPPGIYYQQVQRNKVTYTAKLVAYAGATQKTVSRYNIPFTRPVNRSFSLLGHGNASHYIGWTETPENHIDDLDPEAWAKGEIINANDHFDPNSVIIESESNFIDNAIVSDTGNSNTGNSIETITFACGVHSGTSSESSDHEWVYESCPSSHARYECDGSDHSLQASCSETNSNGDSCTITNFYVCASHTHAYPELLADPPTPAPPPPTPTTVACGGASYTGCSGASSRTAHHVPLCSNGCGNGYWTCSASAVRNHETSFTCRRCGTSFTRCSNGTCTHNGRTYTYHDKH